MTYVRDKKSLIHFTLSECACVCVLVSALQFALGIAMFSVCDNAMHLVFVGVWYVCVCLCFSSTILFSFRISFMWLVCVWVCYVYSLCGICVIACVCMCCFDWGCVLESLFHGLLCVCCICLACFLLLKVFIRVPPTDWLTDWVSTSFALWSTNSQYTQTLAYHLYRRHQYIVDVLPTYYIAMYSRCSRWRIAALYSAAEYTISTHREKQLSPHRTFRSVFIDDRVSCVVCCVCLLVVWFRGALAQFESAFHLVRMFSRRSVRIRRESRVAAYRRCRHSSIRCCCLFYESVWIYI